MESADALLLTALALLAAVLVACGIKEARAYLLARQGPRRPEHSGTSL